LITSSATPPAMPEKRNRIWKGNVICILRTDILLFIIKNIGNILHRKLLVNLK
jgi:hypothetical protein